MLGKWEFHRIALYFLFLLVQGGATAFARTLPGLPFLTLPVGAHGQAMGGAYMAQSRDASATFWNPSGLASLRSKQTFFYHTQFVSALTYDYFAYALPLTGRSTFGVSAGLFSKGIIDGRDPDGKPTGGFFAIDNFLGISLGTRLGASSSIGACLKVVKSSMGSSAAYGAALDLAWSWLFSPDTNLALGFSSLGPSMKYEDEPFHLPLTFSAGLSQNFSPFTFTADLRRGFYDEKTVLSLGTQINWHQTAFFRFGYFSGKPASGAWTAQVSEGDSNFTLGIGLRFFSTMDLDYAFVPMSDWGGTHHADVIWRF